MPQASKILWGGNAVKLNMFNLVQLFITLGVLTSTSVQAHAIWIEPIAGEIHLCFGEYEGDLREETGGKLDKVTDLKISSLTTNTKDHYSFTRQSNFLLLTNKEQAVTSSQALIAQAVKFKVRTSKKDPKALKSKSMQYARYAVADVEASSALVLDIQPIAKNTFKVTFKGKPLVKTKIIVTAPNKWARELQTNEAGEVDIEKPWNGLYLVQASYVEQVSGEFEGEQYESIRHKTTLSIIK